MKKEKKKKAVWVELGSQLVGRNIRKVKEENKKKEEELVGREPGTLKLVWD